MLYVSLAGIGIFIWGLVTLDWFRAGAGLVIFLISFAIHWFKVRDAAKDDKVFSAYKTLHPLIQMISNLLRDSDIDMDSSKAKLSTALFYFGMVDAASQGLHMADDQFLNLVKIVFADLDYLFEKSFIDKILLFHQMGNTEHAAFQAIMEGGDMFFDFIKGNKMVPLTAHLRIEELIGNSKFPASVEAL